MGEITMKGYFNSKNAFVKIIQVKLVTKVGKNNHISQNNLI